VKGGIVNLGRRSADRNFEVWLNPDDSSERFHRNRGCSEGWTAKVQMEELRCRSFSLFLQTSFDFFDGSRDLTDPQNDYSAITAQKVGCFLVGK
jgi:hypothetical protein